MICADNKICSNNVFEAFDKLGKFSENDLVVITPFLQAHSIPKGSLLLKEGKICQSLHFVVKGSFRHFQVMDTGEETTRNLYLENDWVLEYKSFTSQTPTTGIIEAMEDSNVVELSVYDLHKLMKISDVFFQIGRVFQYGLVQQEMQLQNSTPKERYLQLLKEKPQVIQRFPLKHIASFLGMTPETLSRVRRSLTS